MTNGEKMDRAEAHVQDLVRASAHAIHRRFSGYVDLEDLVQELQIYVLQRPQLEKDLDAAYEVSKDETKWVARKLMARFRRHIEKIARKEKAAKLGYQMGDEFFYDTALIATLLPVALQFETQGAVLVNQIDDGTPRKPPVPSEGGNVLGMVIDVRAAYELITDDEQLLLEQRYGKDPLILSDIAVAWNVSDSTIDRRIQVALRKIIDNLGGPSPWA
jgi:DNA-directed RNA polymerase specialized sigma24 family protein